MINVRDDLKLILSSATLDSKKFQKYFNNCEIIKIPGRWFKVDIYYTTVPEPNYI